MKLVKLSQKLFIILIFLLNIGSIFSQNKEINIVICEAEFSKVIGKYFSNPIDSKPRRAIGQYPPLYEYKIKLSIIMYEKSDFQPHPLFLKITKGNRSEFIKLEDDVSLLNSNQFYDYNFKVWLRSSGWYKVYLGVFHNLDIGEETKSDLIFDQRSIYLSN